MTLSLHPTDCDAARLQASAAIDGELDDVGRVQLARHLSACAECARVAARMEEVAELLRGAPRERFRCEPGRLRRLRSTSTPVRHWAGAVVAVVAVDAAERDHRRVLERLGLHDCPPLVANEDMLTRRKCPLKFLHTCPRDTTKEVRGGAS